jgi:hypothetical protein
MPEPYLYDAFVSYRRADGRQAAAWLRRALQAYKPPASLKALFGRRMRVYLDTAYERGTVDFYEHNIRPALLDSRHLVVVATPAAVEPHASGADWIVREIDDFVQAGGASRIVVVRAAGALVGPLPAGLEGRFPNIEIVDLRGVGRFAGWRPLISRRLEEEKLKIIATLLAVEVSDMPLLRQEEERKRLATTGFWAGAVVTSLVAMAWFAVVGFMGMNRAQRALDDSIFATERIVTSVAGAFSAQEKASEESAYPLVEACSLLSKLSREAGRQPDIGVVTTCGIQVARGHEIQKEHAAALRQLDEVVGKARTTIGSKGARAMIEASQAAAETQVRLGNSAGAMEVIRMLSGDIAKRDAALASEAGYQVAVSDMLVWKASILAELKQPVGQQREAMSESYARLSKVASMSELEGTFQLDVALKRGEVALYLAAVMHAGGDTPGARSTAREALRLQDGFPLSPTRDRSRWVRSMGGRIRTAQFIVETALVAGDRQETQRMVARIRRDLDAITALGNLSSDEKVVVNETSNWLKSATPEARRN